MSSRGSLLEGKRTNPGHCWKTGFGPYCQLLPKRPSTVLFTIELSRWRVS